MGNTRRPQTRATPWLQKAGPVTWLFDLDNTLHDTSHAIFAALDGAMTQTIQELLQCDYAYANALRLQYWKRYGATVIGLVKHHNINAHEFLHASHQLDLAPLLHAEKGLPNTLAQLPGNKILLTNAPRQYAIQVLTLLRLNTQFTRLWTMEDMRLLGSWRPKPSRRLLQQLLAKWQLSPAQTIFVEDTLRNLKPAHSLGIKTVHHYHPATPFSKMYAGKPDYVDIKVRSLGELFKRPELWHILRNSDPA